MRERTKATAALCVALLLALFSSGCKESASTKAGLEAVRQRGQLRVAMTGMYPPFNFYDDKNQLAGFDVDVAKELAKRLELEPKLVTLRWDGILAGLMAGRYDVIVGSMAITPEREAAVDFTKPYYVSGAQVFARKDSELAKKGGDLTGAVVGVNLGTTYEVALKKRTDVKDIRTYGGVPEILQDLGLGRIDAFVTDKLVGLHAAKDKGQPIVPVGEMLFEERMGIPVKKGQPELLAALDRALDDMRKDGTYSRLSERWFGAGASSDAPDSATQK